MKKTIYILSMLLLVTLVFQSCEDPQQVEVPSFDVTFNKTAKVGEPIEFTVDNAPNFLNFYSGEFSHEFKNSDRLSARGEFFLSFDTARHYFGGLNKSSQPWSLLVSTDYSGSGAVEDVQAANWTDISNRFTFATARTYTPTNSGTVNISDLAGDTPVYFAFRVYAEGKNSEGNSQGNYRLFSFDISLAVADETYSLDITNFQNPGFKPVNIEGANPEKSGKDNWIDKGNFYSLEDNEAEYINDDWLITNPVNLAGAVEPDRGIPLKTYSDKLKTFEYTYSEPGTYNIAFVGNNQTIYGQKDNGKEFTITITE